MQAKVRIGELLLRVHHEEQALITRLSERERAVTGTVDEMSAKDILAHVSAAKQRQTQRLAVISRGETPPGNEHDEAQIFALYQNHSWQEIQSQAEHIFAQFAAQVDHFTEEDLIDSQRYTWMNGRPLASQILIYGVWHPAGHLVEFYRRQGDVERVRHIYEALVEVMGQQDMFVAMRGDGLNLYNLACACAATGRNDRALELLPEALRLDSELVEISKQDQDLDSLRAEPTFQALYIT